MPTVHFPVLCFPGLAGKGMTYVILQPSCHLPDIGIKSSAEKLVLLWFCCGSYKSADLVWTGRTRSLALSCCQLCTWLSQQASSSTLAVSFGDFRHTAVYFYQP